MTDQTEIKLPKWPFFLGDAVLLGLGYFIYQHVKLPLGQWEAGFFVFLGTLGAVLAVLPFVLEYQSAAKMVESSAVATTVSQIQNLEQLAGQISLATAQWQGVQEHSGSAVSAAREIADRMSTETTGFTEFLKKTNDSERANLRLEIEKLKRSEAEWLQLVVRLLDHTFALHQAAVRSGQENVIEQVGQFQNSCRDVVRRVGLVGFAPPPNAPFDSQAHHSADSQVVSMADARVRETVAPGYTFQGHMIRPALVTLQNPPPLRDETSEEAENGSGSAEPLEERTLL